MGLMIGGAAEDASVVVREPGPCVVGLGGGWERGLMRGAVVGTSGGGPVGGPAGDGGVSGMEEADGWPLSVTAARPEMSPEETRRSSPSAGSLKGAAALTDEAGGDG